MLTIARTLLSCSMCAMTTDGGSTVRRVRLEVVRDVFLEGALTTTACVCWSDVLSRRELARVETGIVNAYELVLLKGDQERAKSDDGLRLSTGNRPRVLHALALW